MTGLLDQYGQPLAHRPTFKKTNAPKGPILGDAFGAWAGRDVMYTQLPGGSVMTFDLSRLTLQDFRGMREHYQLQASLNVLTFILHQIDWHIECDNQEIADQIESNLRDIWTMLIRTIAQSFWSGYGPGVLDWDNDIDSGYLAITKVKDLVPEESRVHWKKIQGWAPTGHIPPTFLSYDGIDQYPMGGLSTGTIGTAHVGGGTSSGASRTIPPDNSFWYPFAMENGDYYGKKLLRPAFPAWFFSNLIHLFANRYFERFGEPTPVGRAPLDEEVDIGGGVTRSGKDTMNDILTSLRSRGVVTLPSDRDPVTKEYEWDIEYLESQMRGADFERYLSRLDEEMSLSVFTPVLLFRTADVGSYNLGQMHLQVFQWMLNSLAGDMKYYIENFVVNRIKFFNWGEKAPRARWVYRKLGKDNTAILQQVMGALIQAGGVMPDLDELGTAIGLTLNERAVITAPPATPDPNAPVKDPKDPKATDPAPTVIASLPRPARDALDEAVKRARQHVANGSAGPNRLGYKKQVSQAIGQVPVAQEAVETFIEAVYGRANSWMGDVAEVFGPEDADRFGEHLSNVLQEAISDALAS